MTLFKMVLLSSLEEALKLACIRNECRHLLTNHQQKIDVIEQTHWFEKIYQKQKPQQYWVWLLKEIHEHEETILGYFAAKESKEGMYITEGLLEKKRGLGMGSFMLHSMLSHEKFRHQVLYADIFNHNYPSICLHKKFGFKKYANVNEQITRFVWEHHVC